jgi:hypothetical protein
MRQTVALRERRQLGSSPNTGIRSGHDDLFFVISIGGPVLTVSRRVPLLAGRRHRAASRAEEEQGPPETLSSPVQQVT